MNTQKCNSTSHMGYVHVPGTQEDRGVLITGSLQDVDSGPAVMDTDSWGERHLRAEELVKRRHRSKS